MFFALGRMNVDDPRYSAASYESNTRAGWGVDNFYTGSLTVGQALAANTPLDAGGYDPGAYVVSGGFTPTGPYTLSRAAGQGIVSTQPTQNFTAQNAIANNNTTSASSSAANQTQQLLGMGTDELLKGAVLLLAGLLALRLAK